MCRTQAASDVCNAPLHFLGCTTVVVLVPGTVQVPQQISWYAHSHDTDESVYNMVAVAHGA